ncbi:hypothetical protein [uncultured Methylobacterium sp.]|uniref:hypothetical protein n=1 Tax=uncultured Methylobacterium sp. TaxID=157278 RepID=UPI0035CA05F8
MWSINDRHETPSHPIRIIPFRILYAFDGPQIFIAKFGFIDTIFAKFDETDDSDLWLAAFTDEATIDLLLKYKISLRGAFLNGQCWVVESSGGFSIDRFWPCHHDDLTDDMLPDSGVALREGLGRRPDSVEQAKAFFAVGYRGEALKRDYIKFSSFRILMDNAYNCARTVLSPPELLRSKKSTFDFDMLEPKLGSLIIAIREPLLNSDRISRLSRDIRLTAATMDNDIRLNRKEFFESVNELIDASRGEESDFEVVSRKMTTLRSMTKVLPSPQGLFQSVEFSAAFDDGTASLYMNDETGRKLSIAYQASLDETVTEAGTIQIINTPSKTFVILAGDGRQITCQIGWREYDELRQNQAYSEGAWAVVTGPLLRRPLRDKIWANGVPLVYENREAYLNLDEDS